MIQSHKPCLSLTSKEVSDDISSHSLPTRLVGVAALLKRYSPSLICKGCHLYTTIFKGTKPAPREPKQAQKYIL
jgi:hypothetical protein